MIEARWDPERRRYVTSVDGVEQPEPSEAEVLQLKAQLQLSAAPPWDGTILRSGPRGGVQVVRMREEDAEMARRLIAFARGQEERR